MEQSTKITRVAHPYWSCERKRRYKSQENAEKEIRRIRKSGRIVDGVNVYPCLYCGGWHLAHKNDLIEYVPESSNCEDREDLRLFHTDLQPIDRIALRVMMPGIHYDLPDGTIPAHHVHSSTPIPIRRITKQIRACRGFSDLTGHKQGRLTVVGLSAEVSKRWVVRCQCGEYELRSAKSLLNPKNDIDRCYACRHEVTRRIKYEYKKTGGNTKTTADMMMESR